MFKLDRVVLNNIESLLMAVKECASEKILSFRVVSSLLPLYTHPECVYSLESLPSSKKIFSLFKEIHDFAKKHKIRLTFHPDQFVVLNSPREDVLKKSIEDLKYHDYMADLLGADVINIHGGGVYGDKIKALQALKENILELPASIRSKLTLENDDKSYTPSDLLPLCEELNIPLCYDVHHHRCLPDDLSLMEASKRAYATWNREPLFHISSPKDGWSGKAPHRHHDYIDVNDFPPSWKDMLPLTVDIEAKAKELAVVKLMRDLYPKNFN